MKSCAWACPHPNPGYAPRSEGRGDRTVQDEATASAGTICSLSLWERAGVRGMHLHGFPGEMPLLLQDPIPCGGTI